MAITLSSGDYQYVKEVSATVGSVTQAHTKNIDLAIAGVDTTVVPVVTAPALTDDGWGIVNAFVATAGTVRIKVINVGTTGAPASDPITFKVVIL